MDGHEPEVGARVYDLDTLRSRRSPRASIVIERDGSWHRPGPNEREAAVRRHPSVAAPGQGRAPTGGRRPT